MLIDETFIFGVFMNRIEKTLLRGSGYTLLILLLFYAFSLIADLDSKSISAERFFIVLGFGMLIATAELIYDILTFNRIIKNIIHYLLLLSSFTIIFILGDFTKQKGITAVVVSLILFSVLYFFILGIVLALRRTVNAADKKLNKKLAQSNEKRTKDTQPEKYTPKFK